MVVSSSCLYREVCQFCHRRRHGYQPTLLIEPVVWPISLLVLTFKRDIAREVYCQSLASVSGMSAHGGKMLSILSIIQFPWLLHQGGGQ